VKFVIGFVGGVIAGAVGALLLAPTSGEELRWRLADDATAQWQTAHSQLQKSMGGMQDQLTSLQAQVQALGQKE
jgi:gas vesicle protein